VTFTSVIFLHPGCNTFYCSLFVYNVLILLIAENYVQLYIMLLFKAAINNVDYVLEYIFNLKGFSSLFINLMEISQELC
jgi:hypothetical protein